MGWVHMTTARPVRNVYNLPEADDADATASADVGNDVILYEIATMGIGMDDKLPF